MRSDRSIEQWIQCLKPKVSLLLRWYDVLWSLERANERGVRPFELEKLLIFEQSNLSSLLRRMIDAGLVEEAIFQDDRQGKVLMIMPKGRQIRGQMWKIYGALIREHMSGASKRYDLAIVASALKSLFSKNVT